MTQAAKAIVGGGLLCGVLDISAAFTQFALRGVPPVRIAQAIASGAVGREAFRGGWTTGSLGMALHFVIAFGAATVFVLLSQKLRWLIERPWVSGPLYGAAVHAVMQFVVLPLSRFTPGPFRPVDFAIGLAIHVLCVGLPIALMARKFLHA